MDKKFHALRFIATFYKIAGILIAILTVLSALLIFAGGLIGGAALTDLSRQLESQTSLPFMSGVIGGVISGIVVLISGGIAALGAYAVGEAIYLLIAIEENTRLTAALVRQPLVFQQPAPMPEPYIPPAEGPQPLPMGGM